MSSNEPERGGPQQIPRPALWTPGERPAWEWPSAPLGEPTASNAASRTEPMAPHAELTIDRLTDVFAGRTGQSSPVEHSGGSPSAVLVAIYPDGTDDHGHDQLHVILTRRADTLRHHTGEVSFPGGRTDPGESPVETAIREAHEEIALDPSLVQPLGELDHLTTVTRRAYIVPVVALLDDRPQLHPAEAEVAEILRVPLAELLDPVVFREERWGTVHRARPVYFFELFGDTVWGATAAMLRQFLLLALRHDPGPRESWDPAGAGDEIWFPPAGSAPTPL